MYVRYCVNTKIFTYRNSVSVKDQMLDTLPPEVLGFIIGRHMGYLLQDRTVNTHVVIFLNL